MMKSGKELPRKVVTSFGGEQYIGLEPVI